jgi:hypothetical protein
MNPKILLSFFCFFVVSWCKAQPGDDHFRLVIYDPQFGCISCDSKSDTYKVYGGTVQFVSNDFRATTWIPDLKTIHINDTLLCFPIKWLPWQPYPNIYRGKSYLNTNIVVIVKNNKDTMYVVGDGSLWKSDYYGTQQNLTAVIPFTKGVHQFHLMQNTGDYRRLQNLIYQKYYLENNESTITYNNWNKRINVFKTTKSKYQSGDTVDIIIDGIAISDGSCADGRVVWILQKKEEGLWKNHYEYMTQMDCGKGKNNFKNQTLSLFLISNPKEERITYLVKLDLPIGEYRVVVFDDYSLPYFTESFRKN